MLETKENIIKPVLFKNCKENRDYKIENKTILITSYGLKAICAFSGLSNIDKIEPNLIKFEMKFREYSYYMLEKYREKIKALESIRVYKSIIYVFRVTNKKRDNLYHVGQIADIRQKLCEENFDLDILFIYECDDIDIAKPLFQDFPKNNNVYKINFKLLKKFSRDPKITNKYTKDQIDKKNNQNLYLSFGRYGPADSDSLDLPDYSDSLDSLDLSDLSDYSEFSENDIEYL